MTPSEIRSIIGETIENRIVAHRYGDASLHANGYVSGDPCYSLPDDDYKEVSAAAREQQPDAYHGRVREWVEFQWRGKPCYFITCSDGNGPLGHCVDAGWVCCLPAEFVPAFKQPTCTPPS